MKKKTDEQVQEAVKVTVEENSDTVINNSQDISKEITVETEEVTVEEIIPDTIDSILKLYPQYEECWISKEGFVYPKNAPKYQRKNAVLYKNKYFKS